MDLSNTNFRRERELNPKILEDIAHKLAEGSLGPFDIVEEEKSHTYKHRLEKRSGHDIDDATTRQLPVFSRHTISKRSSDDSSQSYNKEDVAARLEEGEQYLDNILYNFESSQRNILASMARLDNHRGDWNKTPCAKKIFCDVMVNQPADALMLMEKKMATFLSLIQPNEAVSYHLSDVMDAVKRHDCSEFICLGAVDHSRVDTPTQGPGPR
ncbi:uncharacterized protein LOC110828114 [Zootermopsis nevadensis]|uniref:Uncharacterized protein n=1 Tax=Zootermopsis nevadensis TaxID=136037 RepID=A0A067REB2_ZOONE|nr:uncharacterized protein LOC110828114 [Zootermopsis nevadensis]KDR21378.1 hypothetical protein L798_03154 [Zootermopsis nevadensis]